MAHYNFRYYSDGEQNWYHLNKLHRVGGPAVIRPNGDRLWYQDGKLHRVDGPAVIYWNGTKRWYLNDVKIVSSYLE
jgi:hypothetical protein